MAACPLLASSALCITLPRDAARQRSGQAGTGRRGRAVPLAVLAVQVWSAGSGARMATKGRQVVRSLQYARVSTIGNTVTLTTKPTGGQQCPDCWMPKPDAVTLSRRAARIVRHARHRAGRRCRRWRNQQRRVFESDVTAYRQLPLVVVLPEISSSASWKYCSGARNIKVALRGGLRCPAASPLEDAVLLSSRAASTESEIDFPNRCAGALASPVSASPAY